METTSADFAYRRTTESSARAVVLVEGLSDKLALEALAARRGRDLDAEGIAIVPMGGSKNIGSYLARFGGHDSGIKLAGLCDANEEADFSRGLARAGFGSDPTRADMERLGFFVCVADLEDELIRSLGVAAVEQVLDALRDLDPFRTFEKQPAWRGRSKEQQLRRFLGAGSGRKARTVPLLAEALNLTRVPKPLDGVLAFV